MVSVLLELSMKSIPFVEISVSLGTSYSVIPSFLRLSFNLSETRLFINMWKGKLFLLLLIVIT